jgi:hypothetical protein
MQPVSRQRVSKDVRVGTNTNATMKVLLEMFSSRSVQSGYKKDKFVEN